MNLQDLFIVAAIVLLASTVVLFLVDHRLDDIEANQKAICTELSRQPLYQHQPFSLYCETL